MVAERRRADALARKPTTPEPGSVLQERTGSGASTVAPGSELQQELPVTITITKHNTNDEPGAALQVQHRVRNINTAPGSAVARFKIRHMVMALLPVRVDILRFHGLPVIITPNSRNSIKNNLVFWSCRDLDSG
jgi:hypothetical protein